MLFDGANHKQILILRKHCYLVSMKLNSFGIENISFGNIKADFVGFRADGCCRVGKRYEVASEKSSATVF